MFAVALLVAAARVAATDVVPDACTAIEQPQLILSNLGEEDRGRVVLRGRLPGSVLSGAPAAEGGELRIEELGSAGRAVFAIATLPSEETGDCRRLHSERARALRRLPDLDSDCVFPRPKARFRLAENASPDGGDRFILRAWGESLRSPLGSLRVTVTFGSSAQSCGRWTFAAEDCSLDEGDTVLTCRAPAIEAAGDCKRTGCSGQLCGEQHFATTCEFRPEFACYRDATCELQGDGSCDWTPTEDLARCLAEMRGPPLPPPVPGVPRARWFSCDDDDDCIVYPGLDCCGCTTGGGPEVAIHRDAADEVDAYRLCPEVGCPAEYLCRDGLAAVCRSGLCVIE